MEKGLTILILHLPSYDIIKFTSGDNVIVARTRFQFI